MRRATASRSVVRPLCLLAAITAAFLSVAGPAAQANAPIGTFTVTPSTTQAGGHPEHHDSLYGRQSRNPEHSLAELWLPERQGSHYRRPGRRHPQSPRHPPVHRCRVCRHTTARSTPRSELPASALHGKAHEVSGNPVPRIPKRPRDLQPCPTSRRGGVGWIQLSLRLRYPFFIVVSSRTESDYGLKLTITGITQLAPLAFSETTFWGVPADSSHDEQRFSPVGCNPRTGKGPTRSAPLDPTPPTARPSPSTTARPPAACRWKHPSTSSPTTTAPPKQIPPTPPPRAAISSPLTPASSPSRPPPPPTRPRASP